MEIFYQLEEQIQAGLQSPTRKLPRPPSQLQPPSLQADQTTAAGSEGADEVSDTTSSVHHSSTQLAEGGDDGPAPGGDGSPEANIEQLRSDVELKTLLRNQVVRKLLAKDPDTKEVLENLRPLFDPGRSDPVWENAVKLEFDRIFEDNDATASGLSDAGKSEAGVLFNEDHFHILGFLGKGTFGVVFKQDPKMLLAAKITVVSEKEVAKKFLRPHMLQSLVDSNYTVQRLGFFVLGYGKAVEKLDYTPWESNDVTRTLEDYRIELNKKMKENEALPKTNPRNKKNHIDRVKAILPMAKRHSTSFTAMSRKKVSFVRCCSVHFLRLLSRILLCADVLLVFDPNSGDEGREVPKLCNMGTAKNEKRGIAAADGTLCKFTDIYSFGQLFYELVALEGLPPGGRSSWFKDKFVFEFPKLDLCWRLYQ